MNKREKNCHVEECLYVNGEGECCAPCLCPNGTADAASYARGFADCKDAVLAVVRHILPVSGLSNVCDAIRSLEPKVQP